MAQEQRDLLGRCQQDIGGLQRAGAGGARRMVSPVARLGADLESHLLDRRVRLRATSAASALKRRNVERAEAGAFSRALVAGECNEARQKAGQRLAGAGRRDQQCRASFTSGLKQSELMGAGRPAARREPGRTAPAAFGVWRQAWPGVRSSARSGDSGLVP